MPLSCLPPDRSRLASRAAGLGRAALVLALLVTLGGCAAGNFPNPFDRSGATAEEVQVTVDNQNFNDLRIYALGSEGQQTMGNITGRSSQTFTIRWRQTSDLRFRLEFLAGRSYTTNRVTASPGDRVDVFVRENPGNTYVNVRN